MPQKLSIKEIKAPKVFGLLLLFFILLFFLIFPRAIQQLFLIFSGDKKSSLSHIVFIIRVLCKHKTVTINFLSLLLTVALIFPFILIGVSVINIVYILIYRILAISNYSQGLRGIRDAFWQESSSLKTVSRILTIIYNSGYYPKNTIIHRIA